MTFFIISSSPKTGLKTAALSYWRASQSLSSCISRGSSLTLLKRGIGLCYQKQRQTQLTYVSAVTPCTASLWWLNNAITGQIVGQLTSGPAFPGAPSGPLGPKEPYKGIKNHCIVQCYIFFICRAWTVSLMNIRNLQAQYKYWPVFSEYVSYTLHIRNCSIFLVLP